MRGQFFLVGKPIPLPEARLYFHEVTAKMIDSPGFSKSIKSEFLRVFTDEWYREKHIVLAAFSDCHFVILTSFYEFSPCDLSDCDLVKILAICEEDLQVCVGSPCEIDLDHLYKHRLALA